MLSSSAVVGVLKADGLRIARDRFLLSLAGIISSLCLAMRWTIPWATRELQDRWQFDLTPWHTLLTGHITVVLPTVTVGMLGGFILLESREERVSLALRVTPLSTKGYLAVVGTVLALASGLLAIVYAALLGMPLPPWPAFLAAAFGAATVAPPKAFFMAAYASNKVEAMAYSKFVSASAPIALGAYFLAEPWQWLAGFYPPYWAVKAFWVAAAGGSSWPFWALGAPLVSALWFQLFSRKFQLTPT